MSIDTVNYKPWLKSILEIAKHYGIEPSEEQISLQLDWSENKNSDQILSIISRQIGLKIQKADFSTEWLNTWRLPLLLEFKDGQVGVLHKIDRLGNISISFSGENGLSQTIKIEDIVESALNIYIIRPDRTVPDARVDDYIRPYTKGWFWSLVLKDWKRHTDVFVASLLANVLALASIVFSMNVYDRVIPAQAIPTLWVLAIGVLIAAIFEFVFRISRIYISDLIGKRADLRISDQVFGHALRIKNKMRSKSTGSFISQIRELEGVRELVTSTTITVLADLPFFLLFLFIFWFIGGNLVWIILAVVPIMLIPGIFVQKKLAKLAQEGMRESAIRNALLIESVQGIEEIKLLRAEARFQNQWNHMNEVSADISMQQRKIVGWLTTWTQKVQGLTFVAVVLVGAFAVMDGELTTGALVACSILSSRMLMPISQVSGIFGRIQQAIVAKEGLDSLMDKPVDQPLNANFIKQPVLYGAYELNGIQFKYDKADPQLNIDIQSLNIKAGEKIAILGRNGAGKSSLLQILSGMQEPLAGQMLLDGFDFKMLDPSDVRREVGLLNQNAPLFFGTIRENLKLGAPLATDDDLIRVLKMTGALKFIQEKKEGLDSTIMEGGVGFSGGQKQTLLLSRLLLKNPNILLLDEPTAALDDVSERHLISELKSWMGNRTLIVATHRLGVLDLVDRIIVINNGKIVMDGSKEQVLSQKQTR
ncbi:type I secretion system permease/ATPase [Acinetobacter equi]|uniref:ATP-binding protein n=1 Tax=Acinetobacter equi TaxID=1324350 RepID=A0A0N9W2E8_9GAMM|nr:type I secretion system permease/ATPase [Acinetobacter equi]ALH95748.1 ATP-binding protein [Acinetobacter equi]